MKINLTGIRYGKLVVLSIDKNKETHWLCKCDCGNKTIVYRGHLRDGHTTSCGCKKLEPVTHGMTHSKEYMAWQNIVQRTSNFNHPQFHYWGGRGIKLSESWKKFENFYDDMGDKPSDKHTIDRIDNNKGYEKGNCRWATMREQNLNTRRTTHVTFNGLTLSKLEWSEKLGINYITLCARFNRGWSLERILSSKRYTGSNQFRSIA